MTMEAIKPQPFRWYDYSRYTFSLGLNLGEWAVLSGHTASEYDDKDGFVVRGGMGEQVRTAYDKIGAILQTAGFGFTDVARVVEYVKVEGLESYSEAEEVRREVLGGSDPVVNRVVVNRLLRPDALIEVEVTAGKGASIPGVTYLPSLLPTATGDLVGQTREIYEKAGKFLEAAGLGWDRVVKTVDYVTPAALPDYKVTGRVRRDYLGPVFPAATGVIVPRLQDPGSLIQIDFIASSGEPEAVNPGWNRYEKLTYSPAVKAGNILYMSGQAALDPETEKAVHPGDVVAQTEYIYANILKVLEAAGLGPQNLVKTVEYVTTPALANYRATAEVRERLLRKPFPASTGVVCEALLRPEFDIEVDPMAVFEQGGSGGVAAPGGTDPGAPEAASPPRSK
jgi:enamine deaminase RidA (YjgF/YER057c/UK114 family)